MSEMQIFSSAQFGTIRTTEIDGQPWFCLVCTHETVNAD